MTTLVLVEDHQIVREGLRRLLSDEPGFQVVGDTGDGREAVALVERLRPDVLIVDLMLPGIGGLEVARQVRQRAPETGIVVLSMHAAEPYVVEALRSGAVGYVLKASSQQHLARAVREAQAGRRYFSPPLSAEQIEALLAKVETAPLDPFDALTNREREVLHLRAEGLTANAIALELGISARTVETHQANLMRKLDLHSQAELIRYAIQRGLVQ